MKANAKGFTLIELLVVIAIIGLLATVVMTSLNSARKKGRDARRVEDINQIKTALELYYDANGAYPASTTDLVGTYMSVFPKDPQGNAYGYIASPTSGSNPYTDYLLYIELETPHKALDSDVDGTVWGQDCEDTNNMYCVQP